MLMCINIVRLQKDQLHIAIDIIMIAKIIKNEFPKIRKRKQSTIAYRITLKPTYISFRPRVQLKRHG